MGAVFIGTPDNCGGDNFIMYSTKTMQLQADGTGVTMQLLVPRAVSTEFQERAGKRMHIPAGMIMAADGHVSASLCALNLGERVCIPAMPGTADWQGYLNPGTRVGRIAPLDGRHAS